GAVGGVEGGTRSTTAAPDTAAAMSCDAPMVWGSASPGRNAELMCVLQISSATSRSNAHSITSCSSRARCAASAVPQAPEPTTAKRAMRHHTSAHGDGASPGRCRQASRRALSSRTSRAAAVSRRSVLVDHRDAEGAVLVHRLDDVADLLEADRAVDELARLELPALDHAQHRGEARRAHAERAQDLHLLQDDDVDRERDLSLLGAGGEAD